MRTKRMPFPGSISLSADRWSFAVAQADDGLDAIVVDEPLQTPERELGAAIQNTVLADTAFRYCRA